VGSRLRESLVEAMAESGLELGLSERAIAGPGAKRKINDEAACMQQKPYATQRGCRAWGESMR